MTKRIENAVCTTLEHARFYLAALPFEDQYMIVENDTLFNPAIPIIFAAECAVRLENV